MTIMKKIVAGAAFSLAALLPGAAQAAGVLAGTEISNVATVDYTVGTTAQNPATSNTVKFLVDRRVNLTVTELGSSATVVVPGSLAQVTTFTVNNSTNAPIDVRLTAAQTANGVVLPFTGTDNFNATNVKVFVDVNNDGIYQPLTDTTLFVDELAPDTSKTVFVVVDIPATQANNDRAGVVLTGIAAEPGTTSALGADIAQTTGADTPGTVDTVYGDAAGYTDAVRDGQSSAVDQYNVTTASITVTKTSKVVKDPFNLLVNPKAIPGAEVEYCIQVANTGGAAATSVTVKDNIPVNTTYKPGTIFAGGTVTAGVCNADGTAEDDDNTGADETDPNGGSFDGVKVSGTIPSVATSATTTVRFTVTIN